MNSDKEPILDNLKEKVLEKMKGYEDFSLFENFAMYMGKVQLLEFCLKNLLVRKYNSSLESLENASLGQVKGQLNDRGIRPDFVELLESVVKYRNYIAHEFLANIALNGSMTNFSPRKTFGDLYRATYELEQIILIYDWCEEFDGWD